MHTRQVTAIQTLIRERLTELDLSYRAAAAKSGGLVSHATLSLIVSGGANIDGLTPRVIKGIALAVDLPVSEVEKSVTESGRQPLKEFKLPKKADRLSPAQRKAVLALVDALLEDEKRRTFRNE